MITATLATCEGREESLEQTINSLKDQVDQIRVYVNYELGFKDKPMPEGAVYRFMTKGDLADMGKFVFEIYGHHLVCDDDLTYPDNYAKIMVEAVEHYGKVCSLHGCNIKSPVKSYYKERKDCVHCLAGFDGDHRIMIPGSGVMAYHTSMLAFSEMERYKYMADIYVAQWLQKKKIGAMAIGHPAGWLKHNDIDHSTTIWSLYHDNDKRQAEAINEIKEWKLW